MSLEQSYSSQPAGSGSPVAAQSSPEGKTDYWPLTKLRKCYTDFIFNKRDELNEQIDARRYYHGSHWTAEQLRVMKKRNQPAMTFNRISRKINGVVGLIEKLRQDPKAYARTPQHAEGADLATAALRYVLDEQAWKDKSPQCALDGAVDGIGGIEIEITQGDQKDSEVAFQAVDVPSFFYDPRSYRDDFSDARYQGIGKWVDEDIAKQMFPKGKFEGANDYELQSNSDREMRWFQMTGGQKRVRLVDIWYKHNDGWCWAIFTGSEILMEGKSYLKDEKGKDFCKYIMYSSNVDQDGDRYGFIRNMKSPQDGINARQSKMQHILASRRIILSQGAVDDIEKIRAEWARPDGVVITNRPVNEGVKTDDQSFDFAGWTKLLELNLQEIENFGPNPALIGQGLESQSGRAIALLQQAGMAELGPYILSYRGWKIRVYRALWNTIQLFWKAERWVRVTDDQNLAQYIQINGIQTGQDGTPQLVNAIGSLDVDIILDEGPDHINGMQDIYETLSNVLPSIAPVLSPGKAQAIVDILIESSPLPADVKKKFRDQAQQEAQAPPPVPPEVQALQAKSQIDLQSQQQKAQLSAQQQAEANAAKREALAMDLEHKQKSAELDLHYKHQHHMLEHQVKTAGHQMDMEMMAQSNQADMQHTAEKNRMAVDMESQKSEKSEAGQVKQIAKSFENSLGQLADSFKEAMLAAASKDKEPKHIKVERDKAGRVAGATVS